MRSALTEKRIISRSIKQILFILRAYAAQYAGLAQRRSY